MNLHKQICGQNPGKSSYISFHIRKVEKWFGKEPPLLRAWKSQNGRVDGDVCWTSMAPSTNGTMYWVCLLIQEIGQSSLSSFVKFWVYSCLVDVSTISSFLYGPNHWERALGVMCKLLKCTKKNCELRAAPGRSRSYAE